MSGTLCNPCLREKLALDAALAGGDNTPIEAYKTSMHPDEWKHEASWFLHNMRREGSDYEVAVHMLRGRCWRNVCGKFSNRGRWTSAEGQVLQSFPIVPVQYVPFYEPTRIRPDK